MHQQQVFSLLGAQMRKAVLIAVEVLLLLLLLLLLWQTLWAMTVQQLRGCGLKEGLQMQGGGF